MVKVVDFWRHRMDLLFVKVTRCKVKSLPDIRDALNTRNTILGKQNGINCRE